MQGLIAQQPKDAFTKKSSSFHRLIEETQSVPYSGHITESLNNERTNPLSLEEDPVLQSLLTQLQFDICQGADFSKSKLFKASQSNPNSLQQTLQFNNIFYNKVKPLQFNPYFRERGNET